MARTVSGIIRASALTIVVVPMIFFYLPVHVGRLSISDVQHRPLKSRMAKISKKNFSKFKKVMCNPDIPSEIQLEICKMVVCSVLDLDHIIRLINENRFWHSKFIDEMLSELELSLRIYRRTTISTYSATHRIFWVVSFDPFDHHSPLSVRDMKKLIAYMEFHNLKFKLVEATDNIVNNVEAVPGRIMYSDSMINQLFSLSSSAIYFSNGFSNLQDIYPTGNITSLYVGMGGDISTNVYPNLVDVSLEVHTLISDVTIENVSTILSTSPELLRLKINFYRLTSNESVVLDDSKKLFKLLQKHPKTKVELAYLKSAIAKEETDSIHISINHVYDALKSLEHNFNSVALPLQQYLPDYLSKFTKLTVLSFNVFREYDGSLIYCRHKSLKSLRIVGSGLEHSKCKLLFMNLERLALLKSLKIECCSIDSRVFDHLPSSLANIVTQDCKVVGGGMKLSKNTRSLTLGNCYPTIDFSLVSTSTPRLKLCLSTLENPGERKAWLVKLIKSMESRLFEIKLKPQGLVPAYVKLIVNSYYQKANDDCLNYVLQLEVSEQVQSYEIFNYYKNEFDLTMSRDPLKSFEEQLSDLIIVCMNQFISRDKLIFNKPKWKIKQIITYDQRLVRAVKKAYPDLKFGLRLIDSKLAFPTVRVPYTILGDVSQF